MIQKIQTRVLKFLKSEDGPTIVEYAILLALIASMAVAAIIYVGVEINGISEHSVGAMGQALNK